MSEAKPFDLEGMLRPVIREWTAYVPVQPVDPDEVIKLNANENVYGCSPRVAEALRHGRLYHVYPDPAQARLRSALARYTGLEAGHIVGGAGSDELIDLVLRLVINPGDKVIDCTPTFDMYRAATRLMDGEVMEVRRRPHDFAIDITGIERKLDSRTKVIFLASPNNPTGSVTPEGDIRRLLDTGRLVVVDEAYYEFCGKTMAEFVTRYPNLIVLRTLSKWAGLAGLRIGYGLFPKNIAQKILDIKQPYNISAAAETAALVSLDDTEYLLGTVRKLVGERDRLFRALQGISFLDPLPSEANFILCRVKGRDAAGVKDALAKHDIYIRYFDRDPLRDCIRISAGKPEQTDAVLRVLRAL